MFEALKVICKCLLGQVEHLKKPVVGAGPKQSVILNVVYNILYKSVYEGSIVVHCYKFVTNYNVV